MITPGDRLRGHYARNALRLRAMLAKAIDTGRPVRGYTRKQLRASVTEYTRLSTATDAELLAHFDATHAAIKERTDAGV